MSTTIPRFLLPRSSAIWRPSSPALNLHLRTSTTSRPASTRAPAKPQRVLEKPTKFNPPSHGSRLRNPRPSYVYPGPQLSPEAVQAQGQRQYPRMMPPEGSFLHWFLTNKSIHIYITLGTLFSLAGFTFVTNFKRTSPFAEMLPPASDLFFHPIRFGRTCVQVLQLQQAATSAETAERRKQKVDDVAKRGLYRKAHGMENSGFGGWTAKEPVESTATVQEQGDTRIGEVPAIQNSGHGHTAATSVANIPAPQNSGQSHTAATSVANDPDGGLEEHVQSQRKPVKKWLGIW